MLENEYKVPSVRPKQQRFHVCIIESSGDVVVKLLHCGGSSRSSNPGLVATISEIGYILLKSPNMDENPLKRRKSSKQPTNINILCN